MSSSVAAKNYLSLQIYEWLGKIQWKSLSEKEDFYSNLNMEDITEADCAPTKKVWKDFEIKNINLKNIIICMFKAIHYC